MHQLLQKIERREAVSDNAQIYVLPQPNNTGYGAAAELYWNQGWRGVLPFNKGTKGPPPPGRTGHDGEDPSYPDLMQYIELYAEGNLALRMPDTVIGIDIDAYSGKTGAATIAEAEKRWGQLPAGPRSTSRLENGDQTSGIRFFRIPAGTRLAGQIQFDELGIGHIEVIQHHHRYAIAWPSIHKDTNQIYFWYNAQWQHIGIPNIEDFPLLPAAWIEALQATYSSNSHIDLGGTEANTLINRCLTDGPITARVATRLGGAITELADPHGSRHEAMIGHVLTLMRFGKDGETGVKPALIAYQQAFITALTAPGQRHAGQPDQAAAEFRRAIFNHNAARELTAPSHDEWMMRGLATETVEKTETPAPPPTQVAEPAEPKPAETVQKVVPGPEPKNPVLDIYTEEEAQFWLSRPSLTRIYNSSIARMCGPWAVLGHCAARALTIVRPYATTPAIIGGPGSLNSYFIITGVSGSGKSAAEEVARELVDIPVEQRSLGTGEGFIEAFIRPANKETGEPPGYYESVMFVADESDTISALKNRSGSTLEGILKEAWTAKRIAFGYRGRNDEKLNAHTYRVTLVIGAQPTKCDWILNDNGGGFPQRFMWFPSRDRRAWEAYEAAEADVEAGKPSPSTELPLWQLDLPSWREWEYSKTVAIPDEARKLIRLAAAQAHLDRQENPLDGHALFCRLKFAYALTVLDGRSDMTLEDWELAGVASRVSEKVRAWVISCMGDVAHRDAEEQGRLRGVSAAASDDEKAFQERERERRLMDLVLSRLAEKPMTEGALKKVLNSRERGRVSAVLVALSSIGRIVLEDGQWVLR